MKNKVLIIAAHPDDEVLGAGGAAAKHVDSGDDVFCLILGEGALSRDGASNEEAEALRQQARAAVKVIGFRDIFFSSLPDNKFDSVPLLEIVKKVESSLAKIKPRIIYTHYENDLNIDHRLVFQAVITACRPCNEFCPEELYSFEVLSSTGWQSKSGKQFNPNFYINIEGVINKKKKAMGEYKTEIREYPHPRSFEGIEALARYRGLEAGFKFAEAFYLVKKIQK